MPAKTSDATREALPVVARDGQPDAREGQAGPGRVTDGAVVPTTPGNAGRGKGPWLKAVQEAVRDQEIGVSLSTPSSVQKLQAALHGKAKQAPDHRFHRLYDKVYRADVLEHAYHRCKANGGAAGVDDQSFHDIEAYGLSQWLGELAEELRNKTYRPQAVRRVYIPKPDGKQRPLGIPTVKDRVAQMAAVLVLEPIFEADLQPEQYAYRPGRSAHDAIRRVDELLCSGHTQVVDADLSGYFDSIPHAELLMCLRRRIVDGTMLHLLKMWLEMTVEETDDRGRRHRTTTNKDTGRGTPQGAPISPLLANLYMRRFVLGWKALGHDSRLRAHIVNYADDFVICCRGTAQQAMSMMQGMMQKLRLTVNETKTHICHLPDEPFDFLGFTFGRYYSPRTGRSHITCWPSRKRVSRFCAEITEQTAGRFVQLDASDRLARLNRMLVGWRNYFALGAFWKAFRAVDRHAQRRFRRWLCRKHKVQGPGGNSYPSDYLYKVLGLVGLERTAPRYGAARAKP